MASRLSVIARLTASLLLVAGVAGAQDDQGSGEAARLREQLRSTVLQLRELQDQQAAAKAQPAPAAAAASDWALKSRLTTAQARLRAARREAAAGAGLKAELDKARADHDALAAQAGAQAAELAKFRDAYAKAADDARAAAAERDRLRVELAAQSTIASACQAKNARLTAFAEGLIDLNRRITFGQKLAAGEPLIGFTRVRLENIAQDREDTVRAARCDPLRDARPAPAPAPPPAPEAAKP